MLKEGRRSARMNTTTRLLCVTLAIGIVAMMLASPAPATACDFPDPPAPETALDEANAVFSGELVSIESAANDPSGQYVSATFEVERAWKGIDASPVSVETHGDAATCGFPFEKGRSYLVYAQSDGSPLTTSQYQPTKPLENAGDDLDVLGDGVLVEAQADEGNDPADEGFNPGVVILLIVILSIIVATVMLVRQSKPGFPDDLVDDDFGNGGTSDDRDASTR
jgi:hypothetical protein